MLMRLARRCGQRGILFLFFFLFIYSHPTVPNDLAYNRGVPPDYDNRQYQQSHLPG